MGQLTSPPHSARAVARWLIRSLRDPAKPLADVALLVSEDKPRPFLNTRTGIPPGRDRDDGPDDLRGVKSDKVPGGACARS